MLCCICISYFLEVLSQSTYFLAYLFIFCISEGNLQVLSKNSSRNFGERYVFLLDGMIVICKQQKRMGATLTGNLIPKSPICVS